MERRDARERRMYADVLMPRSAPGLRPASPQGEAKGCASGGCTWMYECRGAQAMHMDVRMPRSAWMRSSGDAPERRMHPLTRTASGLCCTWMLPVPRSARMRRSGSPQGEAKQAPSPASGEGWGEGSCREIRIWKSRVEHLNVQVSPRLLRYHCARCLQEQLCSRPRTRLSPTARRLSSARTEVHRVGEAGGRAERY